MRQIRRLLVDSFDGDFADEDWEHTVGGWHVVVADGDVPLSHASVVSRGLEVAGRPFRVGYVEGVATTPARRREGLASLAMAEVSEVLRHTLEMGALSTGLHDFYSGHGWIAWSSRC